MGSKRQATNNLNHDNWDNDEEPEERGTFQTAPEEELKNRVIKRARRALESSATTTTSDGSGAASKSIFGNFTGFGTKSTAAASTSNASSPFAFLAKIPSASAASATAISTSVSTPTVKRIKETHESASPAPSAPDASVVYDADMIYHGKLKDLNEKFTKWITEKVREKPISILSPIFKDYDKYIVELEKEKNDSIKSQSAKPTTISKANSDETTLPSSNINSFKFNNNGQVAAATATVAKTTTSAALSFSAAPSVTAPFAHAPSAAVATTSATFSSAASTSASTAAAPSVPFKFGFAPAASTSTAASSAASTTATTFSAPSLPAVSTSTSTAPAPTVPFSFGVASAAFGRPGGVATSGTAASTTNIFGGIARATREMPKSNGFSFGWKKEDKPDTPATPFSFLATASVAASPSGSTPKPTGFSFKPGGTPFTFGSIKRPAPSDEPSTSTGKVDDEDDDYQPPKEPIKQVVEDDAVYSKKCKVFLKKDETFSDRGVGMLYLKPVKDSEKMQLLVRADTNLGNILVNLILNSSIPLQLRGNNVMMVCIPSPEIEKPIPMLLRVKTAAEAEDLLSTLEQYKK